MLMLSLQARWRFELPRLPSTSEPKLICEPCLSLYPKRERYSQLTFSPAFLRTLHSETGLDVERLAYQTILSTEDRMEGLRA